AVEKALAFVRRTQTADGGWPGRGGVNYLYGTWQGLQGLAKIGVPSDEPMVRRGAGGCGRRVRAARRGGGRGWRHSDAGAARRAAWAVSGLTAAGEADSPAVRAGVRWLLATQQGDGTWHEETFTGTGFPKVFYLKYHYYPLYFPLMAISRYAATIG